MSYVPFQRILSSIEEWKAFAKWEYWGVNFSLKTIDEIEVRNEWKTAKIKENDEKKRKKSTSKYLSYSISNFMQKNEHFFTFSECMMYLREFNRCVCVSLVCFNLLNQLLCALISIEIRTFRLLIVCWRYYERRMVFLGFAVVFEKRRIPLFLLYTYHNSNSFYRMSLPFIICVLWKTVAHSNNVGNVVLLVGHSIP